MSDNLLALVETKRKKIETVWTRSSEALAPAITTTNAIANGIGGDYLRLGA
tara:strand:- start:438 stop:590 length:153 start_codon:yes stop_codon:yes gene_type:complete